jgi:ATP-dependent RNA helicase DeaD
MFINKIITMKENLSFDTFGLHQQILLALEEANFKVPSAIQQEVIPSILAGKDLIGQAQTGTGKTGAFGLPALHLLQENSEAQMLVMTPTRELAKQVSDELYRFSRHLGIRTAVICGGKSAKSQIDSLQRGVRILVATPGRLLDLLTSQQLPHFQPSIVVLDEADEMLDMGFLEDINHIFKFLPQKRQTLLFSATMPQPIQKLAEKILRNPLFISTKQKEKVNQDIEQVYYMVREEERDHAVIRLIDYENPEKAIIFCRTKKDVDRLTQILLDAGYTARGLHGDMEQPQREEVMRNFRSEHLRLLVATDVAARGLSVSSVSHVFNYHLPFDPNQYVHRIGRTGRAGNKGIASTFLTTREWRDFQRFEKVLNTKIQRREIPNLNQVKEARRRHLIDKILAQGIHEETERLLQLMQDVDAKTIASKLISMLLKQQVFLGPDNIGLERKQDQLIKQTSTPVSQKGKSRFSKAFKSSKSSIRHQKGSQIGKKY